MAIIHLTFEIRFTILQERKGFFNMFVRKDKEVVIVSNDKGIRSVFGSLCYAKHGAV